MSNIHPSGGVHSTVIGLRDEKSVSALVRRTGLSCRTAQVRRGGMT